MSDAPPPSGAPARRKVGRPTKLDKQRAEAILSALKTGCHVKTACGVAGVSKTTYHRWMELGRSGKRPEFREFRESVERVVNAVIQRHIATLQVIAAGNPKEAGSGRLKTARGKALTISVADRMAAIKFFLAHRAPDLWADGTRGDDDWSPPGGRVDGAGNATARRPRITIVFDRDVDRSDLSAQQTAEPHVPEDPPG